MKQIVFNNKFGFTNLAIRGRKTMMRMMVPLGVAGKIRKIQDDYYYATFDTLTDKKALEYHYFVCRNHKPPYRVGEIVAIAQSYKDIHGDPRFRVTDGASIECLKWQKGWNDRRFVGVDKMIHFIQITDCKIERIQDISDEDVIKEGFSYERVNNGWGDKSTHGEYKLPYIKSRSGGLEEISSPDPREAYSILFDKTHKIGAWESNPWVFVYEFKRMNYEQE